MSETDERFTRATWRPGKRDRMRKRVKAYGGRKVAPAAFLEAGKRYRINKGRTNQRICSATKRDGTPCGMLALRDLKVCGAHGGFSIWAKQGKLQSSGRTAALKLEERSNPVRDRSRPAPIELMQLEVYRQADDRMRIRMIKAWGTDAWSILLKQREIQR